LILDRIAYVVLLIACSTEKNLHFSFFFLEVNVSRVFTRNPNGLCVMEENTANRSERISRHFFAVEFVKEWEREKQEILFLPLNNDRISEQALSIVEGTILSQKIVIQFFLLPK
jgi:hypothetical protein